FLVKAPVTTGGSGSHCTLVGPPVPAPAAPPASGDPALPPEPLDVPPAAVDPPVLLDDPPVEGVGLLTEGRVTISSGSAMRQDVSSKSALAESRSRPGAGERERRGSFWVRCMPIEAMGLSMRRPGGPPHHCGGLPGLLEERCVKRDRLVADGQHDQRSE